ncbi:MAG: tyrosine-type recombinase/integrase, partial [Ktedonobacterales bacterium]
MPTPSSPTISRLSSSFALSLQAANKAPKTIKGYLDAVALFAAYLSTHDYPLNVASIERRHVEAFIADQLQRHTPASASNRYKSLQQFFRWCVEEEELAASPMAKMVPPHIPEQSPAVLSDDDVRKLLKAASGKRFEDRRDTAIIRLLLDTGMRRQELAEITLSAIDWELKVVGIVAKGRRPRACPFGAKTAQALD